MTRSKVYLRYAADLLTVEVGAEESYSFDRAGCLVRAAWGGQAYRFGLDGKCLVKERLPFGSERRRSLLDEKLGMEAADAAYRQAIRLFEQASTVEETWHALVQLIVAQGSQLMHKRTTRFPNVYSPVGILPPDQYGALVLQLTEGCRYNRCSFCTFYKQLSYRTKTPKEFATHVQAVLELIGEAINRRRTVFLGDANALGLPTDELQGAFHLLNDLIPLSQGYNGGSNGLNKGSGIEGIYTFMDVFGRYQKSAAEFETLARLGLRRVYVGAESGSKQVLKVLRKPDGIGALHKAVSAMKAGSVGVGLVFLLGAGGKQLASEHTSETARLLASLPLDNDDIVYFSELVAEPNSEYANWAELGGITPLSQAEMREQERQMRQGLIPVDNGGPRVTRYDVREFIYY